MSDALEAVERALEPVEWRPAAGYEGRYEVSSIGEVRSVLFGRTLQLKPRIDEENYVRFDLWKDGTRRRVHVARLVLRTFVGGVEGREVRHLDGNPSNNRPWNLAWGTGKENAADRERHGMTPRGEKLSRLTTEDVRAIRASGESRAALARAYGVSPQAISRIVSRKVWRHV